VAHPDIIKIFSIDLFREWAAGDEARQMFRQALTAVHEAGMAIEVSSAGLRKPCAEIYPCPQFMELAAEMGIPVAFGSDAHSEASVGYAFDRLEQYARDFGYNDSVYFVKRRMHSRPF
jgi:histidinol-phosphatase (PHP family)